MWEAFALLSEGGIVKDPIGPMPWSPCCASVIDKFGIGVVDFSLRTLCERTLFDMKTKKQEELVNSFLTTLGDKLRPLYQDIVMCLSELGYNPRKERSYILFMHSLHTKQMAKMGITWTKDHSPYFALRFSACKGYSRRFADIVRDYINKDPDRLFPHCGDGRCIFRAGEDETPAYEYVFPDGEIKHLCGAKALIIPDITADDIGEIKKLIKEEHIYLMKHEAGISVM